MALSGDGQILAVATEKSTTSAVDGSSEKSVITVLSLQDGRERASVTLPNHRLKLALDRSGEYLAAATENDLIGYDTTEAGDLKELWKNARSLPRVHIQSR